MATMLTEDPTGIPADLFFPVGTRFFVEGYHPGIRWRVACVYPYDELSAACAEAEILARGYTRHRVVASTGEVVYETKKCVTRA